MIKIHWGIYIDVSLWKPVPLIDLFFKSQLAYSWSHVLAGVSVSKLYDYVPIFYSVHNFYFFFLMSPAASLATYLMC